MYCIQSPQTHAHKRYGERESEERAKYVEGQEVEREEEERPDNMWEGQVRGKRTSKRWGMHANGVAAAALTHIHEHLCRGQVRGGRCMRMQLLEAISSKIN